MVVVFSKFQREPCLGTVPFGNHKISISERTHIVRFFSWHSIIVLKKRETDGPLKRTATEASLCMRLPSALCHFQFVGIRLQKALPIVLKDEKGKKKPGTFPSSTTFIHGVTFSRDETVDNLGSEQSLGFKPMRSD